MYLWNNFNHQGWIEAREVLFQRNERYFWLWSIDGVLQSYFHCVASGYLLSSVHGLPFTYVLLLVGRHLQARWPTTHSMGDTIRKGVSTPATPTNSIVRGLHPVFFINPHCHLHGDVDVQSPPNWRDAGKDTTKWLLPSDHLYCNPKHFIIDHH